MGLKSDIESILQTKQYVARTLPTRYGAGANTIFTITGGLVQINAILCYKDTAVAGVCTIFITVNGVAMDTGGAGIDIVGNQGSISVCPLGAVAMVTPAILAPPVPDILSTTSGSVWLSRVAGPFNGLIVATFAGAGPLGAAELVSFRCIYRKIDPEASIF